LFVSLVCCVTKFGDFGISVYIWILLNCSIWFPDMKKEVRNNVILGILSIVVGAILYFYWGREIFIIISTIVLGYLTISFLWQLLFCRGRKLHDDKIEFNLSKTGETLMIFYFVGISSFSIYGLIHNMPIWYAWIMPIGLAILCFLRAHEIFANSNDQIIIADNKISWLNDDKQEICSLKTYKFEIHQTDCISINRYSLNTGWHLVMTDKDDKIHSIDLKTMNLNGHKNSIEKHLKRLKLNS